LIGQGKLNDWYDAVRHDNKKPVYIDDETDVNRGVTDVQQETYVNESNISEVKKNNEGGKNVNLKMTKDVKEKEETGGVKIKQAASCATGGRTQLRGVL
jgi:hypothetical protein